ncbi:MAG: ParB/RepB/Spo0J family partition protein [Cyanobacteria bacterium J06632_3]
MTLSVDDIQPLQLPGKIKQPRLYFDPQKMERLQSSIQKYGVLEPILVRPGTQSRYEIISGERRWRSCCVLKIEAIPAVVRDMSDAIALEAALIAQLLTEGITPVEQTESILNLLSLHLNMPIEQVKINLYRTKNVSTAVSNRRGFDEETLLVVTETLQEFGMKLSSFVSNRLPLLNLSPEILNALRAGKLSPTNAILLNRQPSELHSMLIQQSEGLTKKAVLRLLKEAGGERFSPVPSISEQVLARLKSIRTQKSLIESEEAQQKLKEIDRLLKEIEALKS